MLELYYHPVSTFSRRVRVTLIEKDLEAQMIEVDLFARRQFEPAYLAVNPYGRVPAIDDGGVVLYESTVIVEYLEATRPDPPLLPRDAAGRARARLQMRLCDLEFTPPLLKIVRPKRFQPPERWNVEEMEAQRDPLRRQLEHMERELADREWIAGDRFGLADICYLPFTHFLPLAEVEVPPAVGAWAARLADRPSARRTVPER